MTSPLDSPATAEVSWQVLEEEILYSPVIPPALGYIAWDVYPDPNEMGGSTDSVDQDPPIYPEAPIATVVVADPHNPLVGFLVSLQVSTQADVSPRQTTSVPVSWGSKEEVLGQLQGLRDSLDAVTNYITETDE